MRGRDKFEKYQRRNPHSHDAFFRRPHLSRRGFLSLAGAGLTASFLPSRLPAAEVVPWYPVETKNTARNVVFILLAGAPSHVDTFDFKMFNGTTPSSFAPEKINGVDWPAGLMPRMAGHLGDIAIVRSAYSWALQHQGMQTWTQIGRSPTAALGSIAPNIGSIVAVEKEPERQPEHVLPTFMGMNAKSMVGPGYLPSSYAPFQFTADTPNLENTQHPATGGQSRWAERYRLMEALDGPVRANSPLGRPAADFDGFYKAASGLMYNPVVDQAFSFSEGESESFGGSVFGNACLVAAKVLAANYGTRYIQITSGGWDHHADIYDANAANRLPQMARDLDAGLAGLIEELKANGQYEETLIVMMGEFGRRVGSLSPQNGRDHYRQHFVVFGGGGIKGGKVLGSTDPTGAFTTETGWRRDREVRIEDVEATIYSALGINWTNVRYDDPFGRGFDYVPKSKDDVYGPIHELWD